MFSTSYDSGMFLLLLSWVDYILITRLTGRLQMVSNQELTKLCNTDENSYYNMSDTKRKKDMQLHQKIMHPIDIYVTHHGIMKHYFNTLRTGRLI
jgi:hypothetical protein